MLRVTWAVSMGKELNEPTSPGWLRSREHPMEYATSFRSNQSQFPPNHTTSGVQEPLE